MLWSENIPEFGAAAMVPAVVLVVYAAVGEPLLGRLAFAWLRRRRDSDPRALIRFYQLTIGAQAAWTALIAVSVLLAADVAPVHLGLALPRAWGPLVAAALGFCLAMLVVWLITRDRGRSRSHRGGAPGAPPLPPPPDPGQVLAVLSPRTRAERRWAGALAVTAGVSEELLYRAFLVAFGTALGLPVWLAAIASCVLFAVAHVYQGWWGLVGPGLLGALFMVLFLGTGSILLPVLLHILVDLRSLLLSGSGRRHRARAL
ncbi:CPBP family intramembrane glutamic endopeptidase [Streptomonospora nanhaiensis]|uniref:Membrane protease YdiL (CAAX protease family) n=1 Tax=Streptomonospora nanhaiensis TaxID=1323731 RepID=A0A853BMW5_9ACTN|nr:CPBP family intramembrane glutamic endopeptidase [Streptomonospora nanhaiensis]NYI96007.1 membrane protease YdiL (CAAX protease family) [Streptomonospora nanhaiensis]